MNRITKLVVALLGTAATLGACSDGDEAIPSHPALECDGESSGTGNYDLVGPGAQTARAALDDRLGYYQDLDGGTLVELPDDEAALEVDGSIVVVATARPSDDGGFLVSEDYWCDSFRPRQNRPPDTEPLVTSGS